MDLAPWYVSRGRITRRTFWLRYFLPIMAAGLVVEAAVLAVLVATEPEFDEGGGLPAVGWLFLVSWLAALPPTVSSQVTRLHDRGHSAWWLLFLLLPFAGPVVLLVQMCLPGTPGPNQYGLPAEGPRLMPDPASPRTHR